LKKTKSIIAGLSLLTGLSLFAQDARVATGFTRWAKTPPMGWNSWDCYGPTVEEHEVKANADYKIGRAHV
jgi:hypothetical protein